MSRKPSAGSLEAAACSMSQVIIKYADDWEKRRSALVTMQRAVDGTAGKGGPSEFTADLWRYLKEPLKNTLNDLRSAIVKEACLLLEKLSTVAGNAMAALMRDMLSVLLQILTNGNSVIVAQIDSCLRHIIQHTRFPRQLKEIEYLVRHSRSKDLRGTIASYVRLMLGTWPPASMAREVASLECLVSMQLADASSAARTDARASYGLFKQHWPTRAEKILKGANPRTAKTLRDDHGADEDTSLASSKGDAPSKVPMRSASRVPKALATGAPRPFLKKGTSSSEGPGAGEGLGNVNVSGQRPPSPAQATLKLRQGSLKISPSPPSVPYSATKKKAGSSSSPPMPAVNSPSTVSASGSKRRPFHASGRASVSPTLPPAPGSGTKTRRKPRPLMYTPPAGPRTRSRTAGHSPLLVGSGTKAMPPTTSTLSPLLVSPDGFLAGGASVVSAVTLSRGGSGESPDEESVTGSLATNGLGTTTLVPGDKVRLKGSSPRSAIVRYVGATQFATGIWVGVELSSAAQPPGNNDGTVNGVAYFRCPPTRGIFLRADMVELEGTIDQVEANGVESTDGANAVGAEILRCHKLFANEAMDALKDEVGVLRGLEDAMASGQVLPPDHLRCFLEVLENAAEAREAAAAKLRAQIRDTILRHPGIFESPAAPVSSQSQSSINGSPGEPDRAADEADAQEAAPGEVVGAAQSNDTTETSIPPIPLSLPLPSDDNGNLGDPGRPVGTGDVEEAEQEGVPGLSQGNDAGDHTVEEGKVDGGDGNENDDGGGVGAEPPGVGEESAIAVKDGKAGSERARGKGDGNGRGVVGLAGKFLRHVLHIPDDSKRQDDGNKDEDKTPAAAEVVSVAVGEAAVAPALTVPDVVAVEPKDEVEGPQKEE